MEERSYLPVTVDKSHLVTIGERLYAESIELIRELVNNAYDADATEVKVTVTPDSVSVEDNGTGMDLEGLQQYFVIGSQEKVQHPKSPVFKRDRIGQFGIGKFATLSACQRFTVYTQKENFAARVVFDKEAWSQEVGEWRTITSLFFSTRSASFRGISQPETGHAQEFFRPPDSVSGRNRIWAGFGRDHYSSRFRLFRR
jgi:hypothetical protein